MDNNGKMIMPKINVQYCAPFKICSPKYMRINLSSAPDPKELHRVLCQHISVRSDVFGSLVIPLPPKPKQRNKHGRATSQKAGVVHCRRRDGHGERKAKDHNKENDVQASDSVDDISNRPFHPKPTRYDLGPST